MHVEGCEIFLCGLTPGVGGVIVVTGEQIKELAYAIWSKRDGQKARM